MALKRICKLNFKYAKCAFYCTYIGYMFYLYIATYVPHVILWMANK